MATITLTTDFGLTDHFVGVMKAVILRIAPRTRIVDICHEIKPYEIGEGAFVIAEAWRWFPKGTTHLVVVDPGVGTARRPILAEAGGHFFVAPDNGVLSMVYASVKNLKVRAITAERYFLTPVSHTFHGRDIFAPSAAHLARGAAPSTFGKPIEDYCKLDIGKPMRTGKRVWTGTVMKIDRFGNLITNFHIGEFPQIERQPFEMRVGMERVSRMALTFAHGSPGEVFVVVGSSGYLEVAVNQGSAAKSLGVGTGAPAELTMW